MPLDPSIILGLKPAQIQQADPIEQYSKGLALKSLLGKQDVEAMQLAQLKRGEADDQAVRSAYQQAAGDSKQLRALLQSGGQHKALQALDKFEMDKRKDEAEIESKRAGTGKSNLEADLKRAEHAASILAVARKDPSQYPGVLSMLRIQYPQLAKNLPEQYDPRALDVQIANGMTYVQRLADERARETAKETNRHNLKTEGQAAARDAQPVWDSERGVFVTRPGVAPMGGSVMAQGGSPAASPPAAGAPSQAPAAGGTPGVVAPTGLPPRASDSKLTESQGNATAFGMRAAASNKILNELEKAGTTNTGVIKSVVSGIAGMTPFIGDKMDEAFGSAMNTLPSALGGPNDAQQKTEQARRDFINAVLRKESGAVISPQEFSNAARQYFPQPGDSDAVIKQKRDNREMAIKALSVQAGPGAKNIGVPAGPQQTVSGRIGGNLTQNPDGSYNYGGTK